jgi:hypothetical protein
VPELVVQQVLPQVQRQLVQVLRRMLQVQQLVQHFVRALQVQEVSLPVLNSDLLQIVQTLELGEFHPLVRQLQVSLLLSPLVSLSVNKS